MTELTIHLPKPHSKQESFLRTPCKHKIIVAGRRGGKTTGTSILASEAMLDGRRVLYAAPTHDQTEAFWTALKTYFSECIKRKIAVKNETERSLKLGKGRIRAKTAWDADSLRGDYADLLILEEFSLMEPNAWDEVGAPMLLDNNGEAVFIGTPKRRNHFFQFYQRAVSDGDRWRAWHFTSHDNPYLSKDALAQIAQDMTEDAYKQEIMAEFLEGEGQVFRNLAACMTREPTTPEAHKGHYLAVGVDWGKQNDFTAISIGCRDCRLEVAHDRFNRIDYAFQRGRLTALCDAWGVSAVLAESNSMGAPIIEQLQRDGLPVRGFETTASSKPPLIESLALTFERAEMRFIDHAIWTAELEAYERTISGNAGRSTYSAPAGMHDDTVIARALMRQAIDRPSKVAVQANPFYR